jgi:type I restriction enzyme S subunit
MKAVEPWYPFTPPSERRVYKGGGARFEDGDALLARITPCLENGKTTRYVGQPGAKAHGSTEFIVIRGRQLTTITAFAYHFLRTPAFRSYAISQMTGSTGRQRLPVDALEKFNVSLPSLSEQRRIAAILGALDDKIKCNRTMNQTLEAMAQAIFQSWFVDFDGVPPKDLVDSELGPIPRGWEVNPLDQIADYLNGAACQKFRPNEEEEWLPVIKIRELSKGITAQSDRAKMKIPKKWHVKDGDVLFAWSGSLLVKIWTGGPGALNQHLFKVTSKDFPRWFYFLWTARHLGEFQNIAADKATTMGHIKRHHLSDAMCAVPPRVTLTTYGHLIGRIIDRQVSNEVESRTLTQLRDTLLPKLISGEVRVPEAEARVEAVG